MSQGKQQDVSGTMHIEIVQNRIDWLGLLWEPGVDPLQKIHPIGNGPSRIRLRESLAGRRVKRAKDIALPASAIIDFLAGPCRWCRWCGASGGAHQLLTGKALSRVRAHLIQADHDTTFRRVRVEFF